MTEATAQASKSTKRAKPASKKADAVKERPTRFLPTDRINLNKQLDILRAFAAASGPTLKSVGNRDVAGIVKMSETTTSLANAFFLQNGFIRKADGGFIPAAEVIDFQRSYEWNPDTAAHKLRPLIAETWFGRVLNPLISFGALDMKDAIQSLALAASAKPEYENQLALLIGYLEASGLVVREGNQLRSVPGSVSRSASSGEQPSTMEPREATVATAPKAASSVATAFAQPTEGVVQFHVGVRVDMREFSAWSPDRISAFFAGIAQVLAAKGKLEQGASEEN